MRRSYLLIYQKLLETVKITEPFQDFPGTFKETEYRAISPFYCNLNLLILLLLHNLLIT